jgi:hypothetical protein
MVKGDDMKLKYGKYVSVHAKEDIWISGIIAPPVLNLGIIWRFTDGT